MVTCRRPDDALLAGVCADLARRLQWNVWAIRGLFVLGLFIQALAAGAVYLALAVVLRTLCFGAAPAEPPPGGLHAPDLADRGRRIEELERRFRDLERQQD